MLVQTPLRNGRDEMTSDEITPDEMAEMTNLNNIFFFLFQTEDIFPGSYVLEVTSLTPCLEFNEKIFLYHESYTFSVLIQTDKSVYKPGDFIKFRVLVLDFETRPIDVQATLTVAISDANQNRVQIWNDVSTCQGVYNNEFKLDTINDLKLGLWQIEVEFKDKVI
jgi:CD109 antigen